MKDLFCDLLEGADTAHQRSMLKALIDCLVDRSEEQMNKSMTDIFAAVGRREHPVPLERSGLEHSIGMLRQMHRPTWRQLLAAISVRLGSEMGQTLIGLSPLRDKVFMIVDRQNGHDDVRYVHLPKGKLDNRRTPKAADGDTLVVSIDVQHTVLIARKAARRTPIAA